MKTWILFELMMLPLFASGQVVDTAAINRQVDSLVEVSKSLIGKREFDKALEINTIAKKMALEKLGRESAAYGSCCHIHGRVLYNKGNHVEAELWYVEALAIREKVLGKEHADYAMSLNNLALVYKDMGNYEKTEQLNLECKDIREKVLGKEHPDYVMSLNNLAGLYWHTGKYEKAEPLYWEALETREKIRGKEHTDYAQSLNNLALLYMAMGKYEKAEPLYLEAKAIQEKVVGKEHHDYAESLNNLGSLYVEMGKFEDAEQLQLEALTIREKTVGKSPRLYAGTLESLAIVYYKKGDYEKAEPLYLEAKAIKEKVLGKENLMYARTLNNLALLYQVMGNYEKAEPLYLEAKAIREKTLGKEHPDYAVSLNNLALLYNNMGIYDKAEQLYLEALDIREKGIGKEHPLYAASLYNLALLYNNMGNHEKTELLYLEAKAIREKSLGKEHPDYAQSLRGLAILYKDMYHYEKAEPLYLEAKDIYENALGKENHDYAIILNNLADLYKNMGNYEKAESYFIELAQTVQSLFIKSLRHLSERETNAYLSRSSRSQNDILSFARLTKGEKLTGTCYNNILFHNGFLLNASNQIKRLALSDSVTTAKYNLLKSYERRLAAEYSKPITERKNVPELEEKVNNLEKELARNVAGYGEAMQQVHWQEVQRKLQDGEVAIEFIHYRYYDKKQSDSIMYAALVLRPEDASPIFVSLFEERQIVSLLKNAKGGNIRGINALYSAGAQNSLYDLIWKPIEEHLQGAKTVYCSPSGLLHQINIGAIPLNNQQTFSDKHPLVRLNSTRRLVLPNATKVVASDGHIVGGVRYDTDSTTIDESNQYALASSRSMAIGDELSFQTDSTYRGGSWNYLSGTATEASDINHILQSANFVTQIDTGYLATEESFRSLGISKASPRLLHIATHGFFFPAPTPLLPKVGANSGTPLGGSSEPVFKMSDHPMIRSGLILAGAQEAWTTGKAPENREDGILTAYEISQMNLSNTELVVLSACETGLGDIEGNEGVYGLQRAFKIAGAKYLIMSLWKVNDQSTRELMTDFYHQWLIKGMDIPEAFRTAQSDMKKKYPDAPYHWAGFVLVE